jgi:hypothetical protein
MPNSSEPAEGDRGAAAPGAEAKPQEAQPQEAGPQAAGGRMPPEVGGRAGPEPTRFGDWELRGRCIDF